MSNYLSFIEEKIGDLNQLEILELGCGDYSLFEGKNIKNVTAIDKSIDKILSAPQSNIKYLAMDMSQLSFETKFDLIIDAHALHCVLDFEMRDLIYKNLFDSLNTSHFIFASADCMKPLFILIISSHARLTFRIFASFIVFQNP